MHPLARLDDRQREVLGLAMMALGVFLAFVLYGGFDGGAAGSALEYGLAYLVGRARVLAPVALLGGGVALASGAVLPARRPLRTGGVTLAAAIVLALAAGTFGVSAVAHASPRWSAPFLKAHGGVLGEALYAALHPLIQQLGVDILVVFLSIAGLVLLTGASIATVLSAAGGGLLDTTRMIHSRIGSDAQQTSREGPDAAFPDAGEGAPRTGTERAGAGPALRDPLMPPDPDPGELIVRATHVEAPSMDSRPWGLEHAREPWQRGGGSEQPLSGGGGGQALLSQTPAAEVAIPAGGRSGAEQRTAADPGEQDAQRGHAGHGRAAEAPTNDGATGEDEERDRCDAEGPLAQLTPMRNLRAAATEDPSFQWQLPSPGQILARSSREHSLPDTAGQERVSGALIEALGHFGVQAKTIGTVAGPHITRYELRLAPGTKMAKIAQLKDDLAYALAATDIRILAPIPGKQAVGVEVPNAKRRIVRLGDVFQDPPRDWSPLTVWLGKDIAGKAIGADLTKMPHLLVAGTTGAGKSGAINAMLCSVLLRASPRQLRMVLVDPKQVELNHYESIPHLLTPVITSPKMAANALGNLVREMEQRYTIMSLARTRSLPELNRARTQRDEPPLPYILCVIDELADLMMVAPADVEDSIIRLAQKARAVGIHLVLATQSPRVDVITGMIKANVPSRIAFAVSSQTDSRVILDQNGAESLLGQGDMLFSPVGSSRLQRIQGAYIDEAQIAKLTDFWRLQGKPELRQELLEELEREPAQDQGDELDPDDDPLLEEAITLVVEMQTASTSMLQRRLRLGYTRAGRLIDMLERRGVISGYEGSKPRQVLITESDLPRVLSALQLRSSPAASEHRLEGDAG